MQPPVQKPVAAVYSMSATVPALAVETLAALR